MRNKLVKIILAASILLALTFSFSCSSDDDKKDDKGKTQFNCVEYDNCNKEYEEGYVACNDADDYDDCTKKVVDKLSKCMKKPCNDISAEECRAYYEQQCKAGSDSL